MKPRIQFWICLAAVALLYVFHVQLKTAKIFSNPTWSETDEVGQFWSEFAVHYRFAKFFAEHPVSDWGGLRQDKAIQHPDTINSWAEFTIAMEVPAGVIYRWMKPALPFHVWVVWYDCLVSSLSLFALFFLARALWRSDVAGVCASALYAGLYPSYGRTVKNLFLREDFALPLILFAMFFTIRAIQDRKVRDQVLAALVWLAALASWHLTQFVFAVGVGAAVLVYLGKGETPRMPWFVCGIVAGSVLVPVLRMKQFYISPAMCALVALSAAVWINGGRKRAIKVFAGTAAVLVLAGMLLRTSYGEYAHVYELFLYKLRYLGVKPEEPSALSWEARCLWEGAFNTAALGDWWRYLMWAGPGAIVGAWSVKRGAWSVDCMTFVVFTLLLVPLSWMVVRYFTFLTPAVAVLAAGLVTRRIAEDRVSLRSAWWKAAVLGAVVWQLVVLDRKPLDRAPVRPEYYRGIVKWMQTNTPTNAVILASISESPVFLAHTGRGIVLHSKFENQRIRERYREFLSALYGTEEQMYDFACRYGADYFVHDRGCLVTGKDSWRYKADKLGELPAGCVAMLPEMRRFQKVYSDDRFTVLRVVR